MTPLTEVYDSHSDTLQTWTEMPMTMHNIQYHFWSSEGSTLSWYTAEQSGGLVVAAATSQAGEAGQKF